MYVNIFVPSPTWESKKYEKVKKKNHPSSNYKFLITFNRFEWFVNNNFNRYMILWKITEIYR